MGGRAAKDADDEGGLFGGDRWKWAILAFVICLALWGVFTYVAQASPEILPPWMLGAASGASGDDATPGSAVA